MFRHRGVILREFLRTKEDKPKSLIKALHCPYWKDESIEVLEELKFYDVNIFIIPIRAIQYLD
jgi:hypothetical protein